MQDWQDEQMSECWRDGENGKLYLERVEAAAMGVLVKAIIDKDFDSADHCVEIMERLSIV